MKPELEAEIRSFFPHLHRAIACLATVDADRGFAPEIRPVTLMEMDWHFYVATSAGRAKPGRWRPIPRSRRS